MSMLKPSRGKNSLGYYSSSSEDEDSSVAVRKKVLPVDRVDIESYVGKWYQVYTSLSPLLTFELGGRNATAVYTKTSQPDVLAILNRNEPSYLPAQEIRGWARASGSRPGVFHVTLGAGAATDAADAVFRAPGNYWIVALGPKEGNLYQWSVVTNSTKSQIYILCRNAQVFKEYYEKDVLKLTEQMGFTSTWNRPRATEQTHE